MKVTPEQAMRNAGIVSALRKWMIDNEKSVGDLNELMNREKTHTAGYCYTSGKTTPTRKARELISKVTGIPEEQLMPSGIEFVMKQPQPVNNKLSETLHFTVLEDGKGRIRLDIVLPAKDALALLQLIMEGFSNE